jgi:hypothetical protein
MISYMGGVSGTMSFPSPVKRLGDSYRRRENSYTPYRDRGWCWFGAGARPRVGMRTPLLTRSRLRPKINPGSATTSVFPSFLAVMNFENKIVALVTHF